MADFPSVSMPFGGLTSITPYSKESILGNCADLNNPLASTAWPAANRALFIPFRISQPMLMVNGFVVNGATATGNIDIGVYSADGTRLCSTGSTAQSGTTAIQTVAFTTSPVIGPGLFYLALALSSASGTTVACTTNVLAFRCLGMAQQATALPLPATATMVALVNAYLPSMGITGRSLV